MYLDDDHRWYIYGITSFVLHNDKSKKCNVSTPTLFASVPIAAKWLAETIILANRANQISFNLSIVNIEFFILFITYLLITVR